MNEINKILEAKETVIWDGKPQWNAYLFNSLFGFFIVSAILAGLFIWAKWPNFILYIVLGLMVVSLIFSLMSYRVTHYAITNKRAIIQSGIIGRDFKSVDMDKIQNASVDVGLIDSIFKVGSIRMFSGELISYRTSQGSSVESKYDQFAGIPNPYNVLKLLQQQLSERKEKLYGGKS